MSFGANNTSKTAENNLGGISQQSTGLSSALQGTGQNLIGQGTGIISSALPNLQSGANYFNTLLNGNQANTSALLQPSINQIRGGNQNALQAISSLAPRGGGRSGTLFNTAYAPSQQIQSLFNTGRTQAATALPQIGASEAAIGQGLAGTGAGLFANAAAPLGVASGANSTLGQFGFTQQQLSNQMDAAIASGILGLATMPFGGGSSAGGLLGLLGGGGSVGGGGGGLLGAGTTPGSYPGGYS
jgi:hypothetical protein